MLMDINVENMKILDLSLKKEWYDLIESGVKKEEKQKKKFEEKIQSLKEEYGDKIQKRDGD